MKRKLKTIGAVLLSLCMIVSSNVVSASQRNNDYFIRISFINQAAYFCQQDYFENVSADRYSSYTFTPNQENSLKVKLFIVDYNSYHFVPTSSIELYSEGSSNPIGKVLFDSTIGEHYFTFSNLCEYSNYYVKLHSGPNCSVSAILCVSSDGTYK